MTTLAKRHKAFEDLHRSGTFVIPNPWDIGSARMMAALGARALATTSAGYAFTLGRPDMGNVTRDEALAHAVAIVAATPLPVSGDFENGFGDDPDTVAETVRLAAEAGASAARALGRPFVFCARADGLMNDVYDQDEAIRRIQAFEEAGADLLYVPLLPDAAAVARLTHRAIRDAVLDMLGENGEFTNFRYAMKGVDVDALLIAGAGDDGAVRCHSTLARTLHEGLPQTTRLPPKFNSLQRNPDGPARRQIVLFGLRPNPQPGKPG